jgi:hypothetical protein
VRRSFSLLLASAALVGPLPFLVAGPQQGKVAEGSRSQRIDWLSESTLTPVLGRAALREALVRTAGVDEARHFVVQFERPLTPAERSAVRQSGLTLLAPLGQHAFFASARAGTLDTGRLVATPLTGVLEIQESWKLHPVLDRGELPTWAVVDDKGASPVIGTYVLFHPDVEFAQQRAAVQRHGGAVRDSVQTINGLVVELPQSAVRDLAGEDTVQFIEPALPRWTTTNAENRAITGVDVVQSVYGLDGSGVGVMVYDGGTALATHVDFGGRCTVRDGSGTHYHSTHVAGTVGGDGTASGGNNRGMAPGCTIESYGFEYDGSGIFLYTNPGDFEDDYADAILNYGVAVSNNSIGTNTEPNGFDCSYQGDYGLMSSLIDAAVRGSLSGAPYRIVWSAGNERQGSRCDVEGYGDYYSTAPPAGAKNHLAIGALNANDDSMTSFSSWGPTDDGRLKPDFCGPGCQSNGDGGVTSCNSSSNTSYTVLCGTSMSGPTVAGIVALMLQDYRSQYGSPDPRNSTLKVLLAQSAVDLGNVGPDYQFGYGSVRAPAVIDLMRTGNFREAEIDQSETRFFTAIVGPADTELEVTLAWDDFPGTPNVTDALVNDLDLHVFSPTGVEHFPWTLDPLNPSAPAVRVSRDHLNNIEQVHVDSPEQGAWRIEVRGFDVSQGPQPFSIVAEPVLLECGSQGVVAMDSTSFQCSTTAGIQVIDCDLNTDDLVVESVSVTVTSTSEPAGETLLLTETGPATAVFQTSLPLDVVDAVGTLLVAEGDTVTATYIDADDGNGGMGISVMANATIDCTSPMISNVAISNVTATSATIDFDVDESSSVVLAYGTSCGSLSSQTARPANTHHTITIGGLADGTDHFFTIAATDAAGNMALDDNGGACHTFMTFEVPDSFTEEFSPVDMNGLRITYRPNASFEFYQACTVAQAGFPTDPTGGSSLPLSDDDSELVVLGGGNTVKLYGTSYDRFYVGSNGYITFTAGDTDYTESLTDHFDLPRISANFDDYNPSAGGSVSVRQLADHVAVTWNGVPEYGTTNSNSFQIELFYDGRIRVAYVSLASVDGIGGLSPGGGIPSPFLGSDLSDYTCDPTHLVKPGQPTKDGGTKQL